MLVDNLVFSGGLRSVPKVKVPDAFTKKVPKIIQ